MQCSSFTPVYYHARDLNAGANAHPWHIYGSNAGYGEERGCDISMPLGDQYSVHDKEVLKQIIQNHEATFRYQVQELHRLYRRQRELMDETRMREIFAHHLLSTTSESFHSSSHAGAEFSQNRYPATNWLFGNLASNKLSEPTSGNVLRHENVIAEKLEEPFIRKNSIKDVQFLPLSSKQTGNEIIGLEYPAYQRKPFKVGLSGALELKHYSPDGISTFEPASDSDFSSIKRLDFSSSSSNIRKTICFIDLNEPMQLETLPASSSGPLEVFNGQETVCRDRCVPIEAIPESIVPTQPQLLKSDDSSSGGINSSMAIDLNSMPVNCSYETEMTLESPRLSREAKVEMNRSSAFNHATRNRKCSEDKLIGHNKMSDNFLKTGTCIDLNTSVVDEHSLPPSSPTLQIKSAEDTELKGPVSPENEESSPPRGKSEDIQLETPFSFIQGEGEPFVEAAAQTLVNMGSAVYYPLENFKNLCWFAEFISSIGDDLDYETMDHEENKAKGTGTMSRRSGKGQKRGKKQRKDCLTVTEARGCLKPSELKRKAGKNGCAKPRKHSKFSPSDVTKKSMSAILKQSAACTNQGVVQSWGKMKRRQGGRRRRASISFTLAEYTSF